jgi:hypothetical protein
MVDPPLVEGAIGSYIEALFWGGALHTFRPGPGLSLNVWSHRIRSVLSSDGQVL